MRPIRIAFFGNVANNWYQMAKAIRRFPDMDAHLFLDGADGSQNSPENDDPSLGGKYPEWIHRLPPPRIAEKIFPWRRNAVAVLSKYDIVVVSGGGPIFAHYTGRPVVFFATGGDITIAPFPIEFSFLYPSWKMKAKTLFFGAWQRRGIKKCEELWILPFPPLVHGARKLGIRDEDVAAEYCPILIDTDRFKEDPEPEKSGVAAVAEIRSKFDFTVFHPSRFLMHARENLMLAGEWKGNDLLIRAFAKFVERQPSIRAGLVLIQRPDDQHGANADREVKDLIRELGIKKNVLWLQPPNENGAFTRAELIAIYSACDVAAGDFGAGWFGSITLEGLALSRPVIGYVDKGALDKMYAWHPHLSSNTVEGNADFIERLATDPAYKREVGQASRRWIEEFHAPATAGAMYAERFREIAARHGLVEP